MDDTLCVKAEGKNILIIPVNMNMLRFKTSFMMTDLISEKDELLDTQEENANKLKDKVPEFPGSIKKCMEYIKNNIKYPREARKKKVLKGE